MGQEQTPLCVLRVCLSICLICLICGASLRGSFAVDARRRRGRGVFIRKRVARVEPAGHDGRRVPLRRRECVLRRHEPANAVALFSKALLERGRFHIRTRIRIRRRFRNLVEVPDVVAAFVVGEKRRRVFVGVLEHTDTERLAPRRRVPGSKPARVRVAIAPARFGHRPKLLRVFKRVVPEPVSVEFRDRRVRDQSVVDEIFANELDANRRVVHLFVFRGARGVGTLQMSLVRALCLRLPRKVRSTSSDALPRPPPHPPQQPLRGGVGDGDDQVAYECAEASRREVVEPLEGVGQERVLAHLDGCLGHAAKTASGRMVKKPRRAPEAEVRPWKNARKC